MSQSELSVLCSKPDTLGAFHPRCQHVINKPRHEEEARQCRRAARRGTLFCDAHQPKDINNAR